VRPIPSSASCAPLSGEARAYGMSVDSGIRIALADAELGARLPPGFRTVDADSGSGAATAVAELERLIRENDVRLVVGGVTTDEALALIPALETARIVCLSPSASASELSHSSPYFFRLFPTDGLEGRAAARALSEQLGVRRLLIYSDGSGYTRGLESRFRRQFQRALGRDIVGTVHVGEADWRERSSDLLHAHHPQGVLIIGYAERVLEVLEHLRSVRFRGVRCTTSAFYVSDVLRRAGELAEGVVFTLPAYDAASSHEPPRGFVERYRQRFGHEPDIFAAHGYDAMCIAIHSLTAAAGLYTPEIQKAMRYTLREFPGVTGAISFDEHGDVNHYPLIYCSMNGRVVSLASVQSLRLKEAQDLIERLQRPRINPGSQGVSLAS